MKNKFKAFLEDLGVYDEFCIGLASRFTTSLFDEYLADSQFAPSTRLVIRAFNWVSSKEGFLLLVRRALPLGA